jgi:hypothetical protein
MGAAQPDLLAAKEFIDRVGFAPECFPPAHGLEMKSSF